jgi:Zn finger protein HypA/HybF involved in hydrogenase expression
MPSIGQTWVLASTGAVVEVGVLSTLKRPLMEFRFHLEQWSFHESPFHINTSNATLQCTNEIKVWIQKSLIQYSI